MVNPFMQNNLFQKFQQFQQQFQGNADEKIKELVNSGKISQQQYNQAMQMAQQLQKMLGGK